MKEIEKEETTGHGNKFFFFLVFTENFIWCECVQYKLKTIQKQTIKTTDDADRANKIE